MVCAGHFDNDFPIGTMRKDVEVLEITPGCRRRGVSEMHFDSDALGRLRREERHNVRGNLTCSTMLKIATLMSQIKTRLIV